MRALRAEAGDAGGPRPTCDFRHWWDVAGYDADFRSTLKNDVDSVVVAGFGGAACAASGAAAARVAGSADGGNAALEEESSRLARMAAGLFAAKSPSLPKAEAAGEGHPKRGTAKIDGLGTFTVEVFADGFHVSNEDDGETLEVSNVGSPVMLVASTTAAGLSDSVTVAADGAEVVCDVAAYDGGGRDAWTAPCSVAAFGGSRAVAESPDALAEVSGTGALALAADGVGCDGAPPPDGAPRPLRGKIAVAERGACTFEEKARVAEAAGALALIVINSVEGQQRFIMAGAGRDARADDADAETDLAAVMVSERAGAAVADAAAKDRIATLRIYKRPLVDAAVSVRMAPGNSVHVGGRGKWGVFLNARPGHDDYQLFIVKTEAEAEDAWGALEGPAYAAACRAALLGGVPLRDAHYTAIAWDSDLEAACALPLAGERIAQWENAAAIARCECPVSDIAIPASL